MSSVFHVVPLLLAVWLVSGADDAVFDNDIQYVESETGGKLQLQSKGRLSDIVDLDKIQSVKRVLCKGHKILVALKKDEPDVTWSAGQLVIGSDKWKCKHNVLKAESSTIYAKIDLVKRPKPYVVEIHTTTAGPLDMLDDASIVVRYEQGPLTSHRHRRYLSNPLHKVLNHVNWNASFTSNIPFNQDIESQTDDVVNLYKRTGKFEPAVNTDTNMTYDGKDFLFTCNECHGYSHISYYFELKVYKVDNKAVVQKYVMQMEISSHIQQKYSLFTDEEVTLTKSDLLWHNLPTQVFQTPVAIFKTFPPILLTVDYSSQANIELTSMTKNATRYRGDFNVDGKIVISQHFEIGKKTENDITVYNWTVTSGRQKLDTNHSMNASFAFYQNMTILPAISWAQKDVDMNLAPPIHVSTRPKVNVVSTSDTVSRCARSSITVDSNVTVAETDFSVDAFGIHIWDVKLINRQTKKQVILHKPLMEYCHADCHASVDFNEDVSMETACGEPSGPIERGDERFKSLHRLFGDYILFTDEEANSSWCGSSGHPCVNCSRQSDAKSECADRMVNPDLAASLTRLAHFSHAEWPDRKLVVQEAWDEPTSDFPTGKHGDLSVFYEGRAVEVTISNLMTKSLDITLDNDVYILQRLGELAVCSNFASVRTASNVVSMCVAKKIQSKVRKRSLLSRKRRSGHVEHADVKDMLQDLGKAIEDAKSTILGASNLPPALTLHSTYPPATTMELACGDFTGSVSQDDVPRFKRLVEYPLLDVDFAAEGDSYTWCGVETRACKECSSPTEDLDDHWSWCSTRTMSMRLATRLQRLVGLVDGEASVRVEKALSMNISDGSSKLFMEGRAVRLRPKSGSSLSIEEFTARVILAGFDFVSYSSPEYIDVCVKLQDGLQAQLVQFPLANLISVPLPLGEEDEYDFPMEHIHESRKPLLFDNSTSPDNIAEHFKLHHFLSPGKRYLRLDPVLVNILELAYDEFHGGMYVISGSGYRPRSVNRNNIDTRHEKEKFRYQLGQAVELKPNLPTNDDSLFDLAMALIKVSKTIRTQRLGVGLGCKKDRLYFEIRPLMEEDSPALEVWFSGNSQLYERLHEIDVMVTKGGTVVSARPDPVICKQPDLGNDYFYFNFDLDEDGYCWTSHDDFCSSTHEHRFNISEVLQRRLTSAAGTGKLPRQDIMPEIHDCVINACGGCPSAGSIWKQKVLACTKMILKYLARASTPFQPLNNKVAVFNTENHESAVHSQACHDGKICVENTQIYSLLMPLITATYQHEHTEELLFGGADNPSPLLEIVEQELAWRAVGKVDVYVENAKDVNAMRNVIKILMVYNKHVTDIIFHIDPDADEDDVVITLQRKIEQWSGSVCPQWSRLVVTPFTVSTIPHVRKRRSLERSRDRNQMKMNMKNWEVDWMLKS